jgi:hypothetical protein
MLPRFHCPSVCVCMKTATSQLMATVLLMACDGLADAHTSPPPLASFHGTLSLAEHTPAPEGDLRLAIMWQTRSEVDLSSEEDPAFPCNVDESKLPLDPQSWTGRVDPGMAGYTHLSAGFAQQQVRLEGEFPAKFELDLTEPPPPEALAVALGDGFDPMWMAQGQLVVYRDGNSNGKLDESTFAKPSPDQLLGLGARTYYSGPEPRYIIQYIERRPVLDERRARWNISSVTGTVDETQLRWYAQQYDYLRAGYNLVQVDEHWENYERLPNDTAVSLVIEANIAPLSLCQEVCQKPDDYECPANPSDLPAPEPSAWSDFDDGIDRSWYFEDAEVSVQLGTHCTLDENDRETYEYWRSECRGCVCPSIHCVYRREQLPAGVELPCQKFRPTVTR